MLTLSMQVTGGFVESVALSAAGLPQGASIIFARDTLSAGNSTRVTLSAGAAAPGRYTLLLNAQNGSLVHGATVAWTIAESCGRDRDCPLGTLCSSSLCVPGCTVEHGCAAADTCCGGVCVDTNSDIANCGACIAACSHVNIASPSCTAGRCDGECNVGSADCNGDKRNDGCETATVADGNCGGCGVTCSSNACTQGICRVESGNGSCASVNKSACATAYCALPDAGCGFTDSDGDGLSDTWERNGYIDINCNGVNDEGDLQLPGASASVPDIYVVYDWMELASTGEACTFDSDCQSLLPANAHIDENCVNQLCTGHTHDPEALTPGALDAVAARFASRGFNLHILRGHARPHSRVASYRQPSAQCEGADILPGTVGGYAVNVYDLKKLAPSSLPPGAELVYHYSLFSHYSSCDSDQHCQSCPVALNPDGSEKTSSPVFGQTGIAEISGNDLMVSLGQLNNDFGITPDIFMLGGTFMHELGHNLGLRHGGGNEDGPNYKPNYLSAMNYLYQLNGIQSADVVGSNVRDDALTRLDYSTQVLPTGGNSPGALNETDLSEPAGLGSGTADLFSYLDGRCNYRQSATNGPVDWNGDGAADAGNATADLNPGDHPVLGCGAVKNEVFNGHIDWGPAPGQSHFTYAFQCTPYHADRVRSPERIAESELSASRMRR